MKVLIMGLPGAGKSTLAKPLCSEFGDDAVWINADEVRGHYDDWDFSDEGRQRQAARMKYLSDGVVRAGKIAITDFVCPTPKTREEFDPDFIVWMDTISMGRFEDTNKIFVVPEYYDYAITDWDWTEDTLSDLVGKIRERA